MDILTLRRNLLIAIFVVVCMLIFQYLPTKPDNEGFVQLSQQQGVDYVVKKQEVDEMKTLLLYSIPSDDEVAFEEAKQKINNFTYILASHWNVDITMKDYRNTRLDDGAGFDNVIFIEQNRESEAIRFFEDFLQLHDYPSYWIGCGPEEFIRGQERSALDYVSYKETVFTADENVTACNILEVSEDLNVAVTYGFGGQNKEFPAITIKDGKHFRSTLSLPNYYEITSYSLPFLDTFHSFLGHHDKSKKLALLRLEDINTFTYNIVLSLSSIYKYLKNEGVLFHVAFIERYLDPNNGIDIHSDHSPRFHNLIKQMVSNNHAVLIQHGYTHQYGNEISGIGFEFWDGENDAPIQFESIEDEETYTRNKIAEARVAMEKAGLPALNIWETPHYQATDNIHKILNEEYPIRYEHIPHIGELPFAVRIDGTVFIPENLGFIVEPDDLEQKKDLLKKLSVFEDPVASVFWHPWRERYELETLVEMLHDEGYEFVHAYDLLDEVSPTSSATSTLLIGSVKNIWFGDWILYLILTSFLFGVGVYGWNVFQVRKHFKSVNNFSLSMSVLVKSAKQRDGIFPKLALFIPARNEALVIENTLRKIDQIDYPRRKMAIYVIVDERELDDDLPATTKEVAAATLLDLHKKSQVPFIHIVEVPKWYSGKYGDLSHTYAKSTKGRALNYCLQNMDKDSVDMLGILDADGRLHQDVFKAVALKRIEDGSKLLQGPVFQVSNYNNVSIVGKAAGMELALHHLTELPRRLKYPGVLQFLAGTNYFIDTKLIQEAGGWDQDALVEDAELAYRLYITNGVVGDWIDAPELEQTPANFSIYRRQRERWVRGHLDLLDRISKSGLPFREKFYFYKKIVFSQLRFLFDIGLPTLSIIFMFVGTYIYLPLMFKNLAVFLFIASIFVWDTYGFMFRKLAVYVNNDITLSEKMLNTVQLFLFLPVFIIVQSIPRIEAIYNSFFATKEVAWYKTERTSEAPLSTSNHKL